MSVKRVKLKGDVAEYSQNQFAQTLEQGQTALARVRRAGTARRFVAYILKAVAIFGGLALAYGLAPPYPQIIGVAIALAVALDNWSTNHKRMLSATEASYAYDAALKKAERLYSRELPGIIKLGADDKDGEARDLLVKLCSDRMTELQDTYTGIETALKNADLRALQSLAVQQQAEADQAAQTPPNPVPPSSAKAS